MKTEVIDDDPIVKEAVAHAESANRIRAKLGKPPIDIEPIRTAAVKRAAEMGRPVTRGDLLEVTDLLRDILAFLVSDKRTLRKELANAAAELSRRLRA